MFEVLEIGRIVIFDEIAGDPKMPSKTENKRIPKKHDKVIISSLKLELSIDINVSRTSDSSIWMSIISEDDCSIRITKKNRLNLKFHI